MGQIVNCLLLLLVSTTLAVVRAEDYPWVKEELSLISELKLLVAKLKGVDKRLLRHDAMDHTHAIKEDEGICDKLHHALSYIVEEEDQSSQDAKFLVCELATLCITDHPDFRNVFSGVEGVYNTVVSLAKSINPKVAAKAAHLIYIASFAHKGNQYAFFEHGAVEALVVIVKNRRTKPIQRMYALAALQNLAATYCTDSEGDAGSCEWGWKLEKEHISILEEDQLILSDGRPMRQVMAQDAELFNVLKVLVCSGPVSGLPSETNVHPGYNGLSTGRDDNNPAIVPWAAAGLLKNLALEPPAKRFVENSMVCLCHMSNSPDWLESSKAEDCMHHMRREGDPCWFKDDEIRLDCIDRNFIDVGYSTCEDYESTLDDDCDEHVDIFSGVSARIACCTCGGGFQLEHPNEEL